MAPLATTPEIAHVLDLEGTLNNLGGDPELLQEILDYFVELVPGQLDDLEAVLRAGDVSAVDLQAHAMKGGAANVGAIRVSEVARELELLAKGGGLDGAVDLFQRLRDEFEALRAVVPTIDWSTIS